MRLAVLLTALAAVFPAAAVAAPSASYTTAPAGPPWYTGERLTFTSTGSCDVAPCAYAWADDGGDGPGGTQWPLGTGASIGFTFQVPAIKRVRLTVRNAAGQTATVMREHLLSPGPRPGTTPPIPPPSGSWPNLTNTGARGTLTASSSSITASTAGQVIQNLRLTNGADIRVTASNVVIRNVRLEGGVISWSGNRNVLIEDVTVTNQGGTTVAQESEGVIGYGGGTLRRVQITYRSEGVRDGDSAPLRIEDSFIQARSPSSCSNWHGDGLQGYGSSGTLTIRNVYFGLIETGCGGTAPFFYPGRDNTGPVIADRVVVQDGGYSFRMSVPGSVTNLHIAPQWGYGPISVKCSVVAPWSAWVSNLDANYQPTPVRSQPCNTEAGPPG